MTTNEILSLPYEWIFLYWRTKDGKRKKKPFGTTYGWDKTTAENNMAEKQYAGWDVIGITRCIPLKNTGIMVIDIDIDCHIMDVYRHYPMLKDTIYIKGNTRGFHFYIKSSYTGGNKIDSLHSLGGDLITEKIFEKEGKEWFNTTIKYIPIETLRTMVKEDVVLDKPPRPEPSTDTESVSSEVSDLRPITDEERDYLDLIDPTKYTSYNEWMMFVSACKNSWSDGIDVADHYSSKLSNYVSKEDVEKYAVLHQNKGFLINLVKASNLQKYHELKALKVFKRRPTQMTAYELADFLQATTDNVIKVRDNLYYYENGYWTMDTTSDRNHVKRILISHLRDVIKKEIKKAFRAREDDIENEEKKKHLAWLDGILLKINNPKEANSIISEFNTYTLNQEISFDAKPYLFCFKNCAFDLKTNSPYIVKKEDYITMYVPYNWSPSTSENLQSIHDLFVDILPDEDVRNCKISTLRCGMIGLCFENFVMESGSGGNGKDVLGLLYNATLTATYYYKASTSTLLDMKIKSGGNPEVANMNKKRYVVFSEPPPNATLNMGVLKDLTGGGSINARQLYSKNCETLLENMTVFICNEKPNIGGDVGDAEMRRFINIPYTQRYSINEEFIKMGYKRANPYLKTPEYQEENKVHLFNYLLSYDYVAPYIPKCIREETQKYLFGCDNTASFLSDKIIFTEDDKDIVSLRDITDLYRSQYHTGSREFRNFSAKKMMEILQRNVIWGEKVHHNFYERYTKRGMDKIKVFEKMKLVEDECDT